MADQQLNIQIKLKDDFSQHLVGMVAKVNDLGRSIEHAGRQMNQMGTRMTFLGSALTGSFALAMKNAMQYSPEVNKTMREIGNSMEQLTVTVAQAVLPVFRELSNAISNVVAWFKQLDPQLRDQILQWVMIGGAVMMFGGIALKVIGTIITIVGKLIAGLNPVTVGIFLIIGATVMMIKYWDKVREVVLPILTIFELGVKSIEWAILKVVDAVLWLIEKFALVTDTLKGLVTVMQLLGQIPKGVADVMKTALDGVKANVKNMRQAVQDQIKQVESDLVKAATTGVGAWAENVDNAVKGLEGFMLKVAQFFKVGTDSAKKEIEKLGNFVDNIAKQMAGAMERSLGDFFYRGLTGQLQDAKEMFADFGRAVLQILTQALAKLILFQTVGKAFEGMLGFNMFQFHQGGVVRRAHSGMMASDEVPIIAQSGEGIVSRKGMNALGIEGFNKLNKGEQARGGSETPQIVVYQAIHAWDYRDVYRNRKVIANGIIEEIRKNGDFRTAMREYR